MNKTEQQRLDLLNEDKIIIKEYRETTNYAKFKNDYNRKLSQHHILKLRREIQADGYDDIQPVIVDKDFNIIDGQHRVLACKALGVPFVYVIVPDERLDKMYKLNVNHKAWKSADWVSFYAKKLAIPDYIRLAKLMEDTKFGPTTIMGILSDALATGSATEHIKNGTLTFTPQNEKKVRDLLGKAVDVISLLSHAIPTNGRAVDGLVKLSKADGFSWETMRKKAKMYASKAHTCTCGDEYAFMFLDLFNYNTKDPKKRIISLRSAKYTRIK